MFGQNFTQVAAAQQNVFSALGVDWQQLILQLVAFLLLVVILGKWVYPWLVKSVDERKRQIDEAAEAASEAKAAADTSERTIANLLEAARKEAADIIHTARQESAEAIADAQKRAQESAEYIIAEAQEQVKKDVAVAQKQLRDQTLELVSLATKKVVGETASKEADNQLIARILEEVE